MIVVIGSINLDLIATVERLPRPGETVPGSTFSTAAGGKGANQAVAAARAGAEVRMVGAVGKDSFAREALQCLLDCQVDLSSVRETHAATGTALILVGLSGENMIAVIPGGNGTIAPGDVNSADIAAGDVLLVQHEIPIRAVRAALEAARAVGATSILNTAPVRAEAKDLLAMADYVVANETEFDKYAELLDLPGSNREERMQAFASRTGRCIIVTLGKEGATAAHGEELVHISSPEITAVDTVGAGDTFCGYLAASIEAGLELEEALVRATVAGALACLKPGAQPSIPFAAEVDEAMAG